MTKSLLMAASMLAFAAAAQADTVRFATYNASLNRNAAGELANELATPGSSQPAAVAEVIQRVNPDILLVNEFDVDLSGKTAADFQKNYLGQSQNGQAAVDYKYVYVADSNTGVVSGFDLNNDGVTAGAGDAGGFPYANDSYGFGTFQGQYGFAVFSKHKLDTANIRSFQKFLWKDMPGNLLTNDPSAGTDNLNTYYSADEIAALRLSSKNHVDIPVIINGQTVHVLASHPTPPVFDGSEDRNGKRNHDEIRFWADYVASQGYFYDDQGRVGGLANGERFVIMGDMNADPYDGDSYKGAINQLLNSALINGSDSDASVTPAGSGGVYEAGAQAGANADHKGNPAFDTADFGFAGPGQPDKAPGNLRVDYVLPSVSGLDYQGGGVFWHAKGEAPYPLANYPTSDHRLVYVDLQITAPAPVPLPGAAGLLMLGLGGLAALRRR